MTTLEFLSHLRSLEVRVWTDGERLRYRGPDQVVTPQLLTELSLRKQEILDFLGGTEVARCEKQPRDREDGIPLSYSQESQWIIHCLDPTSSAYHIPFAIRFTGDLHLRALEESLELPRRRHEILRTHFPEIAGRPVQRISEATAFTLPVVDLTGELGSGKQREIQRLMEEHAQRPFDLTREPGWRAALLRLRHEEHYLLINMHHIITDDRSINIFMRELAEGYAHRSRGLLPSLPELPMQYADFAIWQRGWLQGRVLERLLAYWTSQLEGSPAVLELPTDRPRPAAQSFRGAKHPLRICQPLTQALERLSQQEGSSFFMTLLTAFKILLYRYSGQTDLLVGTPMGGRGQVVLEQVLGFFVNILVMRSSLAGNPGFREALQRVQKVVLDAYSHSDLPFEKLVEELQPERSLSHNPIFQVVLSITPEEEWSEALPGLDTEVLKPDVDASTFDLSLQLWQRETDVTGMFLYSTDLFDRTTIPRMTQHFLAVLEGITADPGQALDELSLLSAAERHQLALEWNDTGAPFPDDLCIHQLFERLAQRMPDAVALHFDRTRLSYGELNARANQLAHHLRDLGVTPEFPVALLMERSIELIVGLLGVLKAGGAYLPLDPAHPPERLIFMMQDAGVRLLLSAAGDEALPSLEQLRRLRLDSAAEILAGEPADNPEHRTSPENLAYVIYTSGSTGRPKAVPVPHRGLLNVVQAQGAAFGPRPGTTVLQFSSSSFDASVFEIVMALGAGATLSLGRRDAWLPGAELVDLLAAEGVTHLTIPPSALASLPVRELPGLHTVTVAGEALPAPLVQRWAPQRRLFNLYGPTETTIWATQFRCRELGLKLPEKPPIGRPIANTRTHLLDRRLRPVPVGVAAELHIAGVGLTRGYLGRPALSAQQFVPNPLAVTDEERGTRLYKTGDLARYRSDGTLEFLGRLDHQVKLRGFRIELGEIEAILGKHPAVEQVVVVMREEVSAGAGSEQRRLAAYAVAARESLPDVRELRDFVRRKLPDYMVPSVFVLLDELPLTPHGKVDRRALPAPEPDASETAFAPPRTPSEEVLTGIWEEVLGRQRVSIHSNFFDLGGHSLLATRLVSRIRESFGVELSIRDAFEQATVAELGAVIDEAMRHHQQLRSPPLVPVFRDRHPQPSFAQQRLWFIDQFEPDTANYNISLTFQLHGSFDVAAFEQALNEVARRHETLRTTFDAVDGLPVQVIAGPAPVAVPVIDLGALPEPSGSAELDRRVAVEVRRPFDLNRGPLWRLQLLRRTAAEHTVVVVMHHIISDGWSVDLLIDEVGALYRAFTAGNPSSLADLPIQYADYAHWQRQWLQGEALETQVAYWREALEGAPPVLELPADRPRPPVQTFHGSRQALHLPDPLSEGVARLARHLGASPFMVLLAAYQILLARYASSDDLIVGVPIAGRNRRETERLIGFFVNMLALRSDLSDRPPAAELIARVREIVLEAHVHQDLPFEKLVEELQPARELGHSAIFQVAFTLNVRQWSETLPGLRATGLDTDSDTAKFDLTLAMEQEEGRLSGVLEYNTDLFDRTTVERMARHYRTLLAGVVAAAQTPLPALPLLAQAERHQLAVEWNETATPYPRTGTVHELFEAQVATTPDAVALCWEGVADDKMSYRELNRRANQLAHYLRRLGVEPEVPVGLCLGRSPEMLVATLAILKAGGVYVPLDPENPKERLAFMLEDTRTAVVLVQESLRSVLPDPLPGAQMRLVDLAEQRPRIARESCENPASSATADNLAYAMYTSGSTGRPKGVAIPHRGIVRLVRETDYVPLTPRDRLAQLANTSFDAATFEIFGALLNGATVVLIAKEVALSPRFLVGALRRRQVSTLFLTTALFNLLAREDDSAFASLDHLLFGGEAVDPTSVRRVLAGGPPARLLHVYGPTESTTFTTWQRVTAVAEGDTTVAIGKPVANTRVYLLDRWGQPIPLGTAGELFVAGDGLARGYLRRPQRTAECFVPDAVSGVAGARLYATGDLARCRSDGAVEFLGRIDQQVKIRGFRIELGEIEAVLAQHPQIAEATVLLREDVAAERSLVAYATAEGKSAPTPSELRDFLSRRLPEYMIPAAYILLDALPVNASGKVDRTALGRLAPDREDTALEVPYAAPRTPTQEVLAGIWSDVLRVERVGIHDNFFALGGHSLLATRIRARAQATLQVDLPLRSFFETPTVAGLAGQIETVEPSERGHAEEITRILDQVTELSEEEVKRLLESQQLDGA